MKIQPSVHPTTTARFLGLALILGLLLATTSNVATRATTLVLPAGTTFSASASHSGAGPGNAFDGNPDTLWNAGRHPVAWIEVDFGSPQELSGIHALVAQSPAGHTVHQVSLDGVLAFTWSGYTSDKQTLDHVFATPQVARRVRITTTVSDSWVAWSEITFDGPNTAPPPHGLVGYWSFDDGTATDQSGFDNHGTITGGAGPTAGVLGQALDLRAAGDYVTIPNSPSLQSATLTVAYWAKLDFVHNPVIATKRSLDCPECGGAWQVSVTSTDSYTQNLQGSVWPGGGDYSQAITPSPAGRWMHVAVTYDGEYVDGYVDGVLQFHTAYSGGRPELSADAIRIGSVAWGGGSISNEYFGLIDELRIYDTALPASEIAALYQGGWTNACAAGTYLAAPGDAACTSAEAGFYVPDGGASAPIACPAGFTSVAGATACVPLVQRLAEFTFENVVAATNGWVGPLSAPATTLQSAFTSGTFGWTDIDGIVGGFGDHGVQTWATNVFITRGLGPVGAPGLTQLFVDLNSSSAWSLTGFSARLLHNDFPSMPIDVIAVQNGVSTRLGTVVSNCTTYPDCHRSFDISSTPHEVAAGPVRLVLAPQFNTGSAFVMIDDLRIDGRVDTTTPVVQCTAGTYLASPTDNACTPASPGTYVAVDDATKAIACAEGTYQPDAGQTSCLNAPLGKFVSTTGAIEAMACTLGTFSDVEGAAACQSAPMGTFVDIEGAAAASACAVGTYQPEAGQTSCLLAPAGTAVTNEGAAEATVCPVGRYQPDTGQTSCLNAPLGSFVSTTGAIEATTCLVGTFSDVEGAAVCQLAPAGTFVASAGAIEATFCAVGTYQPDAGQTTCLDAPLGKFVSTTGAMEAIACSAGTYSAITGATACIPAPAGSFVANVGAASSTLCGAGTYQPLTGQASCLLADAGSYVPASGAVSQLACGFGSTSNPGAIACTTLPPSVMADVLLTTTLPSMVASGAIPSSLAASLSATLRSYQASLLAGNTAAANGQLGAFMNMVRAAMPPTMRPTKPPKFRIAADVGQQLLFAAAIMRVDAPAPVVTRLNPSLGSTLGGTPVTITGTGLAGTTAVLFGATPVAFTVLADTGIKVVSPPGALGTVDVVVTTVSGVSAATPASQFTYGVPPVVTGLSPSTGPVVGGTIVRITGSGFTGAKTVAFGGTAAKFTVRSATEIVATAPAGTGQVFVRVTTAVGTSASEPAAAFRYTEPVVTSIRPGIGPETGGTRVEILGAGFLRTTAVMFGARAATFTVASSTRIVAIAPPGSGSVHILVTTPRGTSVATSGSLFTYLGQPRITSLSPSSGSVLGGTSVTISGTGLAGATEVTFGGRKVNYSVVSATTIVATAPAGTGVVDVQVKTPGGTSAVTPAGRFTYVPLPAVTSLSPSSGPEAGGTVITVTGTNFHGATTVVFASQLPSGLSESAPVAFTLVSPTQIVVTSPFRYGGYATYVLVKTPAGTSEATPASRFRYR